MFHFQVTPWKKTCLNDHPYRCPQCCLPGFNGQPIGFEYTGDEERMNDSLVCYQRKSSGMANRVNDYNTLKDNDMIENMCTQCGDSMHRNLGAYGNDKPPGSPQGMGLKALGPNPTIEAYGCGSCGVEGFCSTCG